jgi:hypothetical protein
MLSGLAPSLKYILSGVNEQYALYILIKVLPLQENVHLTSRKSCLPHKPVVKTVYQTFNHCSGFKLASAQILI